MSEELRPEVRRAGEDVARVPEALRGRARIAPAGVLQDVLQGSVHERHYEAQAAARIRADGEERDDARVATPDPTAPSTRHNNTENFNGNVSCLCLRFQKSSEIPI